MPPVPLFGPPLLVGLVPLSSLLAPIGPRLHCRQQQRPSIRPSPFLPVGALNINGTWTVFISDNAAGDPGTIATGIDLNVDYTPSGPVCNTPTGVNITGITSNQATVNWTDNGSLNYDVEVRTSGGPGSGPAGLAASSLADAGTPYITPATLASSTLHTAYVRANCTGPATSGWSAGTAFTTLCGGATCNYTFRMTDSYGDGWNGATMRVNLGVGGPQVLALTGPPTFGPTDVTLSVCAGATYELVWDAAGTYPTEVGVEILDNNLTPIYSKPPGVGTTGSLFNFVAACGPPPTPPANDACGSAG